MFPLVGVAGSVKLSWQAHMKFYNNSHDKLTSKNVVRVCLVYKLDNEFIGRYSHQPI